MSAATLAKSIYTCRYQAERKAYADGYDAFKKSLTHLHNSCSALFNVFKIFKELDSSSEDTARDEGGAGRSKISGKSNFERICDEYDAFEEGIKTSGVIVEGEFRLLFKTAHDIYRWADEALYSEKNRVMYFGIEPQKSRLISESSSDLISAMTRLKASMGEEPQQLALKNACARFEKALGQFKEQHSKLAELILSRIRYYPNDHKLVFFYVRFALGDGYSFEADRFISKEHPDHQVLSSVNAISASLGYFKHGKEESPEHRANEEAFVLSVLIMACGIDAEGYKREHTDETRALEMRIRKFVRTLADRSYHSGMMHTNISNLDRIIYRLVGMAYGLMEEQVCVEDFGEEHVRALEDDWPVEHIVGLKTWQILAIRDGQRPELILSLSKAGAGTARIDSAVVFRPTEAALAGAGPESSIDEFGNC